MTWIFCSVRKIIEREFTINFERWWHYAMKKDLETFFTGLFDLKIIIHRAWNAKKEYSTLVWKWYSSTHNTLVSIVPYQKFYVKKLFSSTFYYQTSWGFLLTSCIYIRGLMCYNWLIIFYDHPLQFCSKKSTSEYDIVHTFYKTNLQC